MGEKEKLLKELTGLVKVIKFILIAGIVIFALGFIGLIFGTGAL